MAFFPGSPRMGGSLFVPLRERRAAIMPAGPGNLPSAAGLSRSSAAAFHVMFPNTNATDQLRRRRAVWSTAMMSTVSPRMRWITT
jgi:hypothetical protein